MILVESYKLNNLEVIKVSQCFLRWEHVMRYREQSCILFHNDQTFVAISREILGRGPTENLCSHLGSTQSAHIICRNFGFLFLKEFNMPREMCIAFCKGDK